MVFEFLDDKKITSLEDLKNYKEKESDFLYRNLLIDCNEEIKETAEKVFPRSLRKLRFAYKFNNGAEEGYNKPLDLSSLVNLQSLVFEYFPQQITSANLPPNLENMSISNLYLRGDVELSGLTKLRSLEIGGAYTVLAAVKNIPPSLRSLKYTFPSIASRLNIDTDMDLGNLINLQTLVIRGRFTGKISNFPPSLLHLELTNFFQNKGKCLDLSHLTDCILSSADFRLNRWQKGLNCRVKILKKATLIFK